MLCAKYINEYIEISKSHLDYIYTFLRCGSVTKTTLALFLLHSSSFFFYTKPKSPAVSLVVGDMYKIVVFIAVHRQERTHFIPHNAGWNGERERAFANMCGAPSSHACAQCVHHGACIHSWYRGGRQSGIEEIWNGDDILFVVAAKKCMRKLCVYIRIVVYALSIFGRGGMEKRE